MAEKVEIKTVPDEDQDLTTAEVNKSAVGDDMSPEGVAPEEGCQGSQFVARVTNLPIVSSALGQLVAIYQQSKQGNKLVRVTLETAESGVKVAANTAKPIIDKLEGPSKKTQYCLKQIR